MRVSLMAAAIVSAGAMVGVTHEGRASPIYPPGTTATYSLDVDGCSGNSCGNGPFGSVTLTQVSSTDVSLNVTLSDTQSNVTKIAFAGTGAGESFEFNAPSGLSITLSSSTKAAGFEVGPAPATASTFGTFDYSITCHYGPNPSSPCLGASRTLPGPIDFTTTDGSALNISDFVANSNGYYFASDVAVTFTNNSVKTGNVGADGAPGSVVITTPPVPEPASLSVLALGLLGVMAAVRYRRAA